MLSRILLLSLLLAQCEAFALTTCPRAPLSVVSHRQLACIAMQEAETSEEPSDIDMPSEIDPGVIDVPEPAEEVLPQDDLPPLDDVAIDESAIAKEALKAETGSGITGKRPDKAVVGEILLALEAQNPTRSPATSPLLNGKWKFLYATGASPGLKALESLLKGAKLAPKSPSGADIIDVQDTVLTISSQQPRASASTTVRFLSFENTIKLESQLEAESAIRLVETYEAAASDYMNLRLPFQSPVQYKRSILISYLDEDMMVVRDSFGRPDVLIRVDDAAWSSSSVSGGSTNEDETAPGAS